ncbi:MULTISPECIES: head-tail connector protein [unclassified Meridianimarinicoccus]|uniref:head-tail connector protein n=1 Tax=unclassified Meridianimarinicoccus TaxID=2923344 RepID=UPI001867D24D|nr:hypothetical protein [Fluviibacterium sp. MJW13]
MKLVELAPVSVFDLPMAELREHLRLGTGFADDDIQDPVLERALRAALDAIEARTGKVLFARAFRWTVSAWRSPVVQALPVAPVTQITALSLVEATGAVTPLSPADVTLEEDLHRPQLHPAQGCLPTIPMRGKAEVTFVAGFAANWSGIPADLAQAVLLMAAHFYEARLDGGDDGNLPFGVGALIARYRTVRILGGASA